MGAPSKIAVSLALAVVLSTVAAPPPAAAAEPEPVAMVEEAAPETKLQAFDTLMAGQVIHLLRGTLVLSYLDSCRRETIRGGAIVTIGKAESSVVGGSVTAEQAPCGTAKPMLMAEHRAAGAMVTRDPGRFVEAPKSQTAATAAPAFTWNGPPSAVVVFEVGGRAPVLVWSTSEAADGVTYPADAEPLVPGRRYSVRVSQGNVTRAADFTVAASADAANAAPAIVVP